MRIPSGWTTPGIRAIPRTHFNGSDAPPPPRPDDEDDDPDAPSPLGDPPMPIPVPPPREPPPMHVKAGAPLLGRAGHTWRISAAAAGKQP